MSRLADSIGDTQSFNQFNKTCRSLLPSIGRSIQRSSAATARNSAARHQNAKSKELKGFGGMRAYRLTTIDLDGGHRTTSDKHQNHEQPTGDRSLKGCSNAMRATRGVELSGAGNCQGSVKYQRNSEGKMHN